jgi:catechol 2,3-dioxygenase
VLGFGLMAAFGQQAAFLAAAGYHHHLGTNTWESAGAPPPDPGMAALRHWTPVLPDAAERDRVLGRLDRAGHAATDDPGGRTARDPSGNVVLLAVA